MRRVALTVAVVCLVGLAGCSTLSGGDATTTEEGYTPGADAPSWLAADGTVNESALLSAHLREANESVVGIDQRNGNDSVAIVRGPDATYARDDGGETWTSGSLELRNATPFSADYGVTFDRQRSSLGGASAVAFGLSVRLSTAEYEAVGTTTRDGERFYELEAVGPKGLGSSLGHYTGTALVDPNGRIHSLSGEVGENESVADAYSYAFDWSVDSVPKPEWTADLPQVDARLGPDNETVVLDHTGGATIPAGSELSVSVRLDERFDGTAELETALETGETLVLGIDDGGDERRVRSGRGSLSGSLVDLTGSSVTVENDALSVDGRTVDLRVSVGASVL
ncbi:hypothetical protein GJ629_02660 [Halapricum sp. CBA1109]|uniref:hypothetical protein n=1 Tax=Halapricum sp. CBA1109 TaxID=2668068 RepID=UPI0012FC2008|nr:hypothetical protein [Halapricum sp. CBA1109]MUV88929.1 hypothetical protein [Halapricum sp. CBA1109]